MSGRTADEEKLTPADALRIREAGTLNEELITIDEQQPPRLRRRLGHDHPRSEP